MSLETLLGQVEHSGTFLMAHCDGGYTTNLPIQDVLNGQAWVAFAYDGQPLQPEHGGPARLLVPHLYFWKSAKWVRPLLLLDHDMAGFWDTYGYHIYGDPAKNSDTPATDQRLAGSPPDTDCGYTYSHVFVGAVAVGRRQESAVGSR